MLVVCGGRDGRFALESLCAPIHSPRRQMIKGLNSGETTQISNAVLELTALDGSVWCSKRTDYSVDEQNHQKLHFAAS